MKPKLSLLCMQTIDASLDSVLFDTEFYYSVGFGMGVDAVLTGADSLLSGLSSFEGQPYSESCPEGKAADADLPYLVVTDSSGRLCGKLGGYRNMEYIRDIIVLISESTPEAFVDYLEKHGYGYIRKGLAKCDLGGCLESLSARFGIRRVRVDSVGRLASHVLNEGLVDELWMIASPHILKSPSKRSFEGLCRDVDLRLISTEAAEGGHVITKYEPIKPYTDRPTE